MKERNDYIEMDILVFENMFGLKVKTLPKAPRFTGNQNNVAPIIATEKKVSQKVNGCKDKVFVEIWLGSRKKPRFACYSEIVKHEGGMYTLRDEDGYEITVHESHVVLYLPPFLQGEEEVMR